MPPEIVSVVAVSADDPDEFSELLLPVSPELDISATGRGFRASAKLSPLERVSLFLPTATNARVRKQGVEGIYTLNVPLNEPLECRIAGKYQAVEPGSAYFAGPGDEVDLRTRQGTSTLAVNIAANLMDAHCPGLELADAEPEVFSLASPAGRRLFRTLSALWGEVLRAPLLTRAKLDFEDTLVEALAQTLLPEEDGSLAKIKNTERILDRAKAYIDAHLGDHVAVPDIAWAAATSNRTLHRVFLHEEGTIERHTARAARGGLRRHDSDRCRVRARLLPPGPLLDPIPERLRRGPFGHSSPLINRSVTRCSGSLSSLSS